MRRGAGIPMPTQSGREIWPIDPDPASFDIADIARSLSQLCRYNGMTDPFYSVAEHVVLLSHAVPREFAFDALMHDSPESVVGEMHKPMKLTLAEYAARERAVMRVLVKAFGFRGDPIPGLVKAADIRITRDEISALFPPGARLPDVEPLGVTIHGWPPDVARLRFLERFAELAGPRPAPKEA